MKCELLVVRPRPSYAAGSCGFSNPCVFSKYTKDQGITDVSMKSRRWIPEKHVGLSLDKSVEMVSKDDQCARCSPV